MKHWPEFDSNGDLPVDVYLATLEEVIEHFGKSTIRRRIVAQRLTRIYDLAVSTGYLARFIIFGSFVTAKSDPNDVDIFLLMEDSFSPAEVKGDDIVIFDHLAVQDSEGASVFWSKRSGAFGSERTLIEDWQHTRENTKRGIVEVVRS